MYEIILANKLSNDLKPQWNEKKERNVWKNIRAIMNNILKQQLIIEIK